MASLTRFVERLNICMLILSYYSLLVYHYIILFTGSPYILECNKQVKYEYSVLVLSSVIHVLNVLVSLHTRIDC